MPKPRASKLNLLLQSWRVRRFSIKLYSLPFSHQIRSVYGCNVANVNYWRVLLGAGAAVPYWQQKITFNTIMLCGDVAGPHECVCVMTTSESVNQQGPREVVSPDSYFNLAPIQIISFEDWLYIHCSFDIVSQLHWLCHVCTICIYWTPVRPFCVFLLKV